MEQSFYNMVEDNPIIAAVKDYDGLELCCSSTEIRVAFVLFGNICNIEEIVRKLKEAGKTAIVHIDLIDGLNSKEIAVDFIRKYTIADGIISTKPGVIRYARENGIYTVMRVFVLDSISFGNIRKQLETSRPDFVEILPGLMPKAIAKVKKSVRTPIIAGGLITEKEDVVAALNAGAVAVSTTKIQVWNM